VQYQDALLAGNWYVANRLFSCLIILSQDLGLRPFSSPCFSVVPRIRPWKANPCYNFLPNTSKLSNCSLRMKNVKSVCSLVICLLVWSTSRANSFDQLYNVIEGRAKVQLNKFMRNGTLIKKWASCPGMNSTANRLGPSPSAMLSSWCVCYRIDRLEESSSNPPTQ